jgi:uncharacterized membrane protein YeaQ/YmgE (transglycosylase-associated protein family)
MSLLDLIIMLFVAGIIGALGQSLAGFTRGGCLLSVILGFIGAMLGIWLARSLGLPLLFVINAGGTNFPIIWSIIGAALFVAVISFISRGRI